MSRSFVSSKPHESVTGGSGMAKAATRNHHYGKVLPMEDINPPFWKRMLGVK